MHITTQNKAAGLRGHVTTEANQEYSLLNAILNSSENVIIFSLDQHYCYTSFNRCHIRNMKMVWGVDITTGMSILECMTIPSLKKLAKISIDRALNGEAFSEIQCQPGVNIYYEFFWNPVLQNKKVIGVTAFIMNITARKLAELALQKNDELLKEGEIFAKFGSWRLHPDEQVLYLSEGTRKIFGIACEKITFSEIKEYRLPAYHTLMDAAMRKLISHNEPYDVEFKIKRKTDGKIIDLHSKARFDAISNTVFGTIQDITERKQVQEAVLQSESQYRSVINASPDGIVISSLDGTIQMVSPSALRIFGFENKQEVLGRPLTDFVVPGDIQQVLDSIALMFQHSDNSRVEYRGLRKDGSSFAIEVNTDFVRNAAGEPVNLINIIRDITSRKQTEALLEESNQRYQALSNGSSEAIFISENNICLEQNQMAEKMFGYTDEEAIGASGIEWFVREDQALILEHVRNQSEEPYEVSAIKKDGTTFPCMIRGKQIQYKGRNVRITAIADITEMKRTVAFKLETQDRLLKIARSVPGLIYQFRMFPDGSSCIPYASEAIHEIYRVSPEEVREDASAIFANIHPDDLESTVASIQVSGKELLPWQHEYRVRFADGTIRFHYGNAIPQKEEDGSVLWNGFVTDITDQKHAEGRIRQLSKAVEQSPVSVVITGLAGDIQYVNPKFVELTGYSLDEVLGKNPRILSSGNKSKKEYAEMWATISEGKTWHGEFQNRRKDGTMYWESAIISPILNTKGVITQFIAVKSDITESKKMQAELKESEDVFRILFNESADATLLLDEKGFSDCNQAAVSILGYTSREQIIHCTPAAISPKRQPDGKLSSKKAAVMIREALAEGYKRFEWVHTKQDGTDLHVEVMLTPILLKGKQMFYTLWRDITDRKIAEEKLKVALEKYEFVNHATSDTIWEWDFKTKRISRSKNFISTYGHQCEMSTVEKGWGLQNIHPGDIKMLKGIVNNCIEHKKEHWQAEYRYRCADGTYKFVYDRAFLVYDSNGTLSSMYGAMTDLTEKQKLKAALAEQQLKQQKQLLEVNIQAHEEEKNELGKELHDNISQMLATVKMYLGLAKAGRSIPEFDILSKSYEYIEETIAELRKLSHSLAPPSLGEIGLQEALMDLIHTANLVNQVHIKLVVDKKIKLGDLDKKIELMIYRIIQEQLNNINKYASAKKVLVSIKKEKGMLLLTVTDDGVGFNMANRSKGIGLRNMTNRVEYYSGKLEIISAPGEGCTIMAKIPC